MNSPEIILLTWLLIGAVWLLQLVQPHPSRQQVFLRLLGVVLLVEVGRQSLLPGVQSGKS